MNVIDTLNLLIKTSRDGEEGFERCAAALQSSELRQVMLERAQECARAADELKGLVTEFGGQPDEGTSIAGDLHRGWMIARSALTGQDDHAVLDECERGEDIALRDYRMALEQDLPQPVRAVVHRQLQGVQHNHDQVKALRDALSGATDISRRRQSETTRDGGRARRLFQWPLAQVRLHPMRAVGVVALIGVVGWHALSHRGNVVTRLTNRLR